MAQKSDEEHVHSRHASALYPPYNHPLPEVIVGGYKQTTKRNHVKNVAYKQPVVWYTSESKQSRCMYNQHWRIWLDWPARNRKRCAFYLHLSKRQIKLSLLAVQVNMLMPQPNTIAVQHRAVLVAIFRSMANGTDLSSDLIYVIKKWYLRDTLTLMQSSKVRNDTRWKRCT